MRIKNKIFVIGMFLSLFIMAGCSELSEQSIDNIDSKDIDKVKKTIESKYYNNYEINENSNGNKPNVEDLNEEDRQKIIDQRNSQERENYESKDRRPENVGENEYSSSSKPSQSVMNDKLTELCENLSENDNCSFETPRGNIEGVCQYNENNKLSCERSTSWN